MNKIRVAIVGVGNCASSLVQGIAYYKATGATKRATGPSKWFTPDHDWYPVKLAEGTR